MLATELALQLGAEFTNRYGQVTREPAWTGTERWAQPDGGVHTWSYEALGIPESDEHRLLIYLPVHSSPLETR